MSIPRFQQINVEDRQVNQIQQNVANILNPLVANPITDGVILKSVVLVTGANSVNHLLGRLLQGWHIIRQRAPGAIYDTQDTNNTPTLTLSLISSTDVTVDLYVF